MRAPSTEDLLTQLAAIRDSIIEAESSVEARREQRLALAAQLREAGVSMVLIADAAGVSDSYLTRRLLERGAHRRTTHHWKEHPSAQGPDAVRA